MLKGIKGLGSLVTRPGNNRIAARESLTIMRGHAAARWRAVRVGASPLTLVPL